MLRRNSLLRVVLQPLGIAVVLALVARSFIHIYTIPSASMVPTLRAGDQILVTSYFRRSPARGDVVVFRAPSGEELMIKRIIAEPGDLISTRMGNVLLGGHAMAEQYVAERGASGAIPAQIVPSNCYFVMGDNRADSLDSRTWGVVRGESIVGRARLVLWSSAASSRTAVHAATRDSLPERDPSGSLRLFVTIE